MSKELLIQRRHVLISRLAKNFAELQAKTAPFHEQHPVVNLRKIPKEIKDLYLQSIDANICINIDKSLYELIDIYLKLQDIEQGKQPKKHYEHTAENTLDAFNQFLPDLLLRSEGDSLIQDLSDAKKYADYFDHEYNFVTTAPKNSPFTIIYPLLSNFTNVYQLKIQERKDEFESFLKQIRTNADDEERPAINEILNPLVNITKTINVKNEKGENVKNEKGEDEVDVNHEYWNQTYKQLQEFQDNPNFKKYYELFLKFKAKNLMNQLSTIIKGGTLRNQNIDKLYTELSIVQQETPDVRLKAAIKVSLSVIHLIRIHHCRGETLNLLEKIINITNKLAETDLVDRNYDLLTIEYGKLLKQVYDQAEKNKTSAFWKQLFGITLMFFGLILLFAAIAFAIITLPAAIATAATIATIASLAIPTYLVIAGASLAAAALGVVGFIKGISFFDSGEIERLKSQSFKNLASQMSAKQASFLNAEENLFIEEFFNAVSKLAHSKQVSLNQIQTFKDAFENYYQVMARRTPQGGDVFESMKNSQLLLEWIAQHDPSGHMIENFKAIIMALTVSQILSNKYVEEMDKQIQVVPLNYINISLQNPENIIQLITENIQEAVDTDFINQYRSLITQSFLSLTSGNEVEQPLDKIGTLKGDIKKMSYAAEGISQNLDYLKFNFK